MPVLKIIGATLVVLATVGVVFGAVFGVKSWRDNRAAAKAQAANWASADAMQCELFKIAAFAGLGMDTPEADAAEASCLAGDPYPAIPGASPCTDACEPLVLPSKNGGMFTDIPKWVIGARFARILDPTFLP